ncbi:MAG: helix-turn-helix domain-containing protein [Streptomyces sp.]|nr:helix-turn-helix domain-containing protein [Streptomyces sp.]
MNATDSSREQRLAQLLDVIRSRPGKWTAGDVQEIRRRTGGPVQRGTARRDLAELSRRGLLQQHGPRDGRFYTLSNRKGGNA